MLNNNIYKQRVYNFDVAPIKKLKEKRCSTRSVFNSGFCPWVQLGICSIIIFIHIIPVVIWLSPAICAHFDSSRAGHSWLCSTYCSCYDTCVNGNTSQYKTSALRSRTQKSRMWANALPYQVLGTQSIVHEILKAYWVQGFNKNEDVQTE